MPAQVDLDELDELIDIGEEVSGGDDGAGEHEDAPMEDCGVQTISTDADAAAAAAEVIVAGLNAPRYMYMALFLADHKTCPRIAVCAKLTNQQAMHRWQPDANSYQPEEEGRRLHKRAIACRLPFSQIKALQ